MNALLWSLSLAVAGCYAAVSFHLFKPSDVLGPFLKCVGGNPAYVDAEYGIVFCSIPAGYTHVSGPCVSVPCDRSGAEIPIV